MSKIIKAVYENGVFKPLEDIIIKEHSEVKLQIIDENKENKGFKNLYSNPIEVDFIDIPEREQRNAR